MSEVAIAGDYTDRKGVQAHLGLMILLLVTLISKDQVEGAQALAAIFIALAIPFFLVSLVVLPTDIEDRDVLRMQLILGGISLHAGHISGLIALAFIMGSFHVVAAILFVLAAIVAYLIFTAFMVHRLGSSALDGIWSIVTGKDPEAECENNESLTIPSTSETETEEGNNSTPKIDGHAA